VKTVTVRLNLPDEARYMEVLRHVMGSGSPSDTLKTLFIREVCKRGIDMR
jgi:hypothetical protein